MNGYKLAFAQPPEPGRVLHIKNPNFPQFRFEWHPGKQNVYVIRQGLAPEIGEIVAFNIADHGAAQNAVLIWCRGYRTAHMREPVPGLAV